VRSTGVPKANARDTESYRFASNANGRGANPAAVRVIVAWSDQRVVTDQLSESPPIVTVALVVTPLAFGVDSRSVTVCPFDTVPGVVRNAPPLTE
jgi:hypothetical protein